jgi:7,8-dihydropterin-6-yl-methyl-4-(beta-D-ribofuranosyl)aminobenzene 5'-phosphate synthase
MNVSVTVLVENTVRGQGLLGEHGLACWIEYDSYRVLYDTGQGPVLGINACRLEIPLDRAHAIVLSHGHYDHTGGLAGSLGRDLHARIFAHPACAARKTARTSSGASREVGIPESARQVLTQAGVLWVPTTEPRRIVGGLTATGPIPRLTDFEDTGGPFFLDAECREPDPLVDDQALFFPSTQGIVVLLGCAHAGVINTLRYVRQLTDDAPIYAVMGGLHLVQASEERLERTIQELRRLGVQRLGPAHCTGDRATAALWNAFPGHCFEYHVGTRLEFNVARNAGTRDLPSLA